MNKVNTVSMQLDMQIDSDNNAINIFIFICISKQPQICLTHVAQH